MSNKITTYPEITSPTLSTTYMDVSADEGAGYNSKKLSLSNLKTALGVGAGLTATPSANTVIALNSHEWEYKQGVNTVFKLLSATNQAWFGGALAVGAGTFDANAELTLNSATKGLKLNNLTTANRTAILTPAKGLTVYDSDENKTYIGNGTSWDSFGGSSIYDLSSTMADNVRNVNLKTADGTSILKFGDSGAVNILTLKGDKSAVFGGLVAMGGSTNNKAILALTSTDKGLLIPAMTTAEKTGIGAGAGEAGLIMFDTDLTSMQVFDGSAWVGVGGNTIYTADGSLGSDRTVTMGSYTLSFTGNTVIIPTTRLAQTGAGSGKVATGTDALGNWNWATASNLFNNNGTLSGARVITMGSNDLTLSGAGYLVAPNTRFLQNTPSVGQVATATNTDGSWTWQAAASTIYNGNGSLSGDRTVTMGTNFLKLSSTGEADLFYVDSTNDRIGIGTTSADARLHILSSGSTNSTVSYKAVNSSAQVLTEVKDNGEIFWGVPSTDQVYFTITKADGKKTLAFENHSSGYTKLRLYASDGVNNSTLYNSGFNAILEAANSVVLYTGNGTAGFLELFKGDATNQQVRIYTHATNSYIGSNYPLRYQGTEFGFGQLASSLVYLKIFDYGTLTDGRYNRSLNIYTAAGGNNGASGQTNPVGRFTARGEIWFANYTIDETVNHENTQRGHLWTDREYVSYGMTGTTSGSSTTFTLDTNTNGLRSFLYQMGSDPSVTDPIPVKIDGVTNYIEAYDGAATVTLKDAVNHATSIEILFKTGNKKLVRFQEEGTDRFWIDDDGTTRIHDLAGTGQRFVQATANGDLVANAIPTMPVYTVSGVPAASSNTDGVVIISDETGGRTIATSDGTNWRRVADGAIIS